jgi:hypothetical protein
MKWTNTQNLPQSVVNAILNDPYDSGNSDYTTTTLSKPAMLYKLEKIHADELVEDVADRIYSVVGQIGHLIFERATEGSFIEKRLYTKVLDKVLSGQVDWIDSADSPDSKTGQLIDYKFTGLYAAQQGVKPEWISQASVNRFLCYRNNIDITGATYVAILRDWSKRRASKQPKTYPQQQVVTFDIPMWSLWETQVWIETRIKLFETDLEKLPVCTEEERWTTHDGDDIRCKLYCPAARFCQHGKQYFTDETG